MVFGNRQKLSLSPEDYLFRVTFCPEFLLKSRMFCWWQIWHIMILKIFRIIIIQTKSSIYVYIIVYLSSGVLSFFWSSFYSSSLKHTKVSGAYCLGIFQNADPTTLLGGMSYVVSSLICILCFIINGNTRIKATLCSIPKASNRAYFFLCRVVLGVWILAEFISPFLHLIITGIVVRNTLVTYDRENNKIGFWKTNCSELWMRLNYLGPPPPGPPLVFDSLNRTTEIPPSAAPHGSPDIVSPGRISFKLGFCTLLKYW